MPPSKSYPLLQDNALLAEIERHVLNTANDILLLFSMEKNTHSIQYYNQAASNYFSWDKHKEIGKHFNDVVNNALLKDYIYDCIREFTEIKKKSFEPHPFCQKDKQIIIWSLKRIFVSDSKSNISLLLIGHDITEEESLRNECQQTQDYLDNIKNCMPGNVYWKDREGRYLGCNNYLLKEHSLQNPDQHIVGKTDHDIFDKEVADKLRENDKEVMETGKPISFEENIQLPNQPIRTYLVNKAPLRNHLGHIIGVVGNSIEITELKEAKEQAEIANRTKTEFLAVASHELRVPLTGVLGTASLLAEGMVPPDKIKDFAKVILESGTYLLSNVNSILDFAKLEADNFDVKPIQLDLREYIQEVVHILNTFAKSKGLDLILSFPSTIPSKIISDSRALRYILVNLVNNAIKFTEKGYVLIKAECKKSTETHATIAILIEDTGIGIPEEKLNNIFDHFSQVEDAYKRKSSRSGMGMGLAIVKRLVELLNGAITVMSTLGKGTVFCATFDFELQDASQQEIPWLQYVATVRILVISDNNNGEVICGHTGAALCETTTSDKVFSSLLSAQLLQQPYDILLIDNELKHEKSDAILASIKNNKSLQQPMPVLLLQTAAVAEKQQAVKNGFFATINKPIQPTAFQNALTVAWEKWIENKKN